MCTNLLWLDRENPPSHDSTAGRACLAGRAQAEPGHEESWGTGIARFNATFGKAAALGVGYVISLHPEVFFINRETLNVPLGFLLGM
jgi:hypothetical protein